MLGCCLSGTTLVIASRTGLPRLIIYRSPNVAPPLGPVIGGAISDQLGWKYIFWFLCGLSGLCLLSIVLALPETARCLVGDGSVSPRGIYRPLLPILKNLKHKQTAGIERLSLRSRISVPNPIQSLRILLEKDSATILLCNGIFYATYCCLQASLSSLFISLYGYDELKAGLVYIPFGIGCLVATVSTGTFATLYHILQKSSCGSRKAFRL